MTRSAPANTVIIGIGSNINPRANIRKAKEILSKRFHWVAESKFIKTKPIGFKDQNDFINGAVVIQTSVSRPVLKSTLKQIEFKLGRKLEQKKHYGPRTIDLDILVWNGKLIGRDFYTRDFIRKSVLELMPGLVNGKAVKSRRD